MNPLVLMATPTIRTLQTPPTHRWRHSPNWMPNSVTVCWAAIRVGYTAVIIDGVEPGGVPPDMFLFCADTARGNDTVFYHGFNAGALVTF